MTRGVIMQEELELLKETEIFKNLSAEQIHEILKITRPVSFPAGAIVMREGDIGDTMYIIMKGTVEVVKSLIIGELEDEQEPGKSKVFTRLDAENHAVFGEIALLEAQKRTATIKAVTNCTLCEIRKDDFLQLAETNYELGFRILLNLARIVSTRLRKSDEETVKLTTALSIILREV
ncbi:MAG TPA: cyclic nucleotide-binding domain-containing protein [Syntrophales bacterium]|nr:cyclic nucleotide-binding domain-containing protein [Syntrophales bacterium]HQG34841.1 cyclic nucleotide-binding domain-containing protein [Syntrophales bacterium]HQI35400.1 cyclic nucleotide-binding domain-containing protein [Syntrophales bacterium]